jgi:CRP-like cAMP-binding protein
MINALALRNIKAFQGLSSAEMEDVGRGLSPMALEKGSYLFYRNDPSPGVYFLTKGTLQITIDSGDNREIVVYVIQEGDIVGEMSLFGRTERSASAAALEKCLLFKTSAAKFIEIMNIYPAVAVNLARILVDRLREANDVIERLGTMDGEERVANFLVALAMRTGETKGEFFRIGKKPTYRSISQRLGMSEKTVYRAMRSLMEGSALIIEDGSLLVKKSLAEKKD